MWSEVVRTLQVEEITGSKAERYTRGTLSYLGWLEEQERGHLASLASVSSDEEWADCSEDWRSHS